MHHLLVLPELLETEVAFEFIYVFLQEVDFGCLSSLATLAVLRKMGDLHSLMVFDEQLFDESLEVVHSLNKASLLGLLECLLHISFDLYDSEVLLLIDDHDKVFKLCNGANWFMCRVHLL